MAPSHLNISLLVSSGIEPGVETGFFEIKKKKGDDGWIDKIYALMHICSFMNPPLRIVWIDESLCVSMIYYSSS